MTIKESIFISYRRSDSQDVVGRIGDHLTKHFGCEHIFLDRDSIDYGAAFPDRLKQAVQDSKLLLVVMGSTWLSVRDGKGKRRLDSPDDWVRKEIALALEMGRYVVPILLDGAAMPSSKELPQTIQKLAELNAYYLSTRQSRNLFEAGIDEIINLIEKQVPELKPEPPVTFGVFDFKVVTLEYSLYIEFIKSGFLGLNKKEVTRWYQSQEKIEKRAKRYIEDLGNNIYLEMVYIPGGTFMMGSPASEKGPFDIEPIHERPQHQVKVQPFLMSRYPVTQELWRTVAAFPVVERALELEPVYFKFRGDKQPAQQMVWYEAVEFCQRLSRKTGRKYRLPSEAEWEYACRAGTNSPFHFGGINADVAKYSGRYPKEPDVSRSLPESGPTEVGRFEVANAFGLCDMHGNVWEWCQDYWHDNYQNAPNDGSAWVIDGDSNSRVMRGGSWCDDPRSCRSASRHWQISDHRSSYGSGGYQIGFRVVCSASRTQ
jgi:formylglycine-generating enzyme required for sulfatase activity